MRDDQTRTFRAVKWEDDAVTVVDQRFLPRELRYISAANYEAVVDALAGGAVVGPRCIDIVAGFGAALARRQSPAVTQADATLSRLRRAAGPRAYGFDAIARVLGMPHGTEIIEALAIFEHGRIIDRSIAEHARRLLPERGAILTRGSSGSLSTGGIGTALTAIVAAHRSGNDLTAYVAETSPGLTGRRLAAYELAAANVPVTIIPDAAAAALMRARTISAVIVTAAAIALNGDMLADIGTYSIALAAAHHQIPLYVTVPRASVDRSTRRGDDFEIVSSNDPAPWSATDEETAPMNDAPYPMLYDVSPGRLIAAIVTEYGVSRPPYDDSLKVLTSRPRFESIARQPA